MILPGRATLIGYGVLVLALLVAVGYGKWQHRAAESARAQRDAVKSQLETATDANRSNLVTINAQANALDQWKKLGRSPAEVAAIVANARQREETYNAVFAENVALKAKDKALPECIRLLSMRIDRLCPGRAVSLRNLAAGQGNGAGRDPRPGPHSLSTRTDQGLRTQVSLSGE